MKNRYLILLYSLFLWVSLGYIQNDCNCQKMNKDGVEVLQCQTLPIANDNTMKIGLGTGSISKSHYVNLSVRFKDTAMELDKSLELHLLHLNKTMA